MARFNSRARVTISFRIGVRIRSTHNKHIRISILSCNASRMAVGVQRTCFFLVWGICYHGRHGSKPAICA